jgi:prepilin-type processing-associated H-X9-DG protein
MASPYELGSSLHFRQDRIRVPSSKIMLTEARQRSLEISATGLQQNVTFYEFDGSSWHPNTPVSTVHGKKAMACVADGHVEGFTQPEAGDPMHGLATAGP